MICWLTLFINEYVKFWFHEQGSILEISGKGIGLAAK
jgi:hypothetical protein